MSYSGVAVANVFLEKAFADKVDVDCVMLMGLVYSAHAWSLAKRAICGVGRELLFRLPSGG